MPPNGSSVRRSIAMPRKPLNGPDNSHQATRMAAWGTSGDGAFTGRRLGRQTGSLPDCRPSNRKPSPIPILATQSQQLNERAVRPQAELEEADFLLQRRAAPFIAEEAVVDGVVHIRRLLHPNSGEVPCARVLLALADCCPRGSRGPFSLEVPCSPCHIIVRPVQRHKR